MTTAPLRGEYKELICLKNISIDYVDWGTVEVHEGKYYKECLSGFGYFKENICKGDPDLTEINCALIEIDGQLWPFDKKHFRTLRELREKKLKELGL
jgi:hypothetical protein